MKDVTEAYAARMAVKRVFGPKPDCEIFAEQKKTLNPLSISAKPLTG